MRGQKKDKAAAVIEDSSEVRPTHLDNQLLNEIHAWGAAEVASALRRCEERCVYNGQDTPSKEQLQDAWLLRMVAQHVERLPHQAHLRKPVRVITLKSA